jgi:hypothetical protein
MRKLSVALLMAFALTAACGGGGGGSSSKAFCDELDRQRQSTSSATEADVAAALDKLVALAPSEIKQDMEAIRTFNDLVASAQSAGSTRSAEFDSSLSSASSATNGNFDKVTTFAKDKCGFDLASTASTSFSSVASSIN